MARDKSQMRHVKSSLPADVEALEYAISRWQGAEAVFGRNVNED